MHDRMFENGTENSKYFMPKDCFDVNEICFIALVFGFTNFLTIYNNIN